MHKRIFSHLSHRNPPKSSPATSKSLKKRRGGFIVKIIPSDDKAFDVLVDLSCDVLSLKEVIAERARIPASQQHLFTGGKLMDDRMYVFDYELDEGLSIFCIAALKLPFLHIIRIPPRLSSARHGPRFQPRPRSRFLSPSAPLETLREEDEFFHEPLKKYPKTASLPIFSTGQDAPVPLEPLKAEDELYEGSRRKRRTASSECLAEASTLPIFLTVQDTTLPGPTSSPRDDDDLDHTSPLKIQTTVIISELALNSDILSPRPLSLSVTPPPLYEAESTEIPQYATLYEADSTEISQLTKPASPRALPPRYQALLLDLHEERMSSLSALAAQPTEPDSRSSNVRALADFFDKSYLEIILFLGAEHVVKGSWNEEGILD